MFEVLDYDKAKDVQDKEQSAELDKLLAQRTSLAARGVADVDKAITPPFKVPTPPPEAPKPPEQPEPPKAPEQQKAPEPTAKAPEAPEAPPSGKGRSR